MNAQSPNVALRAALYLRVSTSRQAEHDVSIPDQKRQGEAWCESRGFQLVETFVEPGASATNDRRPEFQRMIEAGTSRPAPFDVVVVHSFSRFFRDHFELEFYVRKLAKNGVKLVSITQEMGDDPMHVMMRQIMALFDEYQSKENAKHVLRALKENARQGFWNGSLPPIGYRVVAAEQRGAKVKKKLEVDPLHADTIRLIYRLALEGEGDTGQMGVKAIVKYLNGKGIFTRDGGRWGIGQVHRVLTRRTYIGEHRFNRRSNKGEVKPEEEVVTIEVPAIIERETFDTVQRLLQARNPKTELPARVVIGPTLLTGICYCGNCGGAMTIRTGKSGRYRYYACSIRARQGETGCKGRAIPMDKLDDMVVHHIEDRLLDPGRLEAMLGTVLGRREDQAERRRQHIAELERRATESELRLKRLYDAIEGGIADLDDPALKERIVGLKVIRDQARTDSDRAQALLDSPGHSAISPAMIEQFAKVARERIRGREGGYRRDHLRALAQRVEVADDAIRIMGSKTELLRTLIAGQVRQSAATGVPRSGLKWRRGCRIFPQFHLVACGRMMSRKLMIYLH
jgi:site-specific DNA recombinase